MGWTQWGYRCAEQCEQVHTENTTRGGMFALTSRLGLICRRPSGMLLQRSSEA